jgi:hypothetical protein
VSFKAPDSLNFVQALGVIETTPEDVPSLAGHSDAFDRFNYDVSYLVQGRIPPDPLASPLPHAFPDLTHTPNLGGGNDERILESFRSALNRSTASDTMLLVFDHIGKLSATEFQQWIFPHLIQPIGDGDMPNVRLLVVLSNDHKRDYWPSESTIGRELRVDACSSENYAAWAEDIILALGVDFTEEHEMLINIVKSRVGPVFKPADLGLVLKIVEKELGAG